MNGRAFDYNLGRFLSVDPFIQGAANSQSVNPYSYILNNPLSGVDPTGYEKDCATDVTTCDPPDNDGGDGDGDDDGNGGSDGGCLQHKGCYNGGNGSSNNKGQSDTDQKDSGKPNMSAHMGGITGTANLTQSIKQECGQNMDCYRNNLIAGGIAVGTIVTAGRLAVVCTANAVCRAMIISSTSTLDDTGQLDLPTMRKPKGEDVTKNARDYTQDLFKMKRLKGDVDIKPGSRADAEILGVAWVDGKNVSRFELDHGGYGLTDGTRTFRLQYKPKDGIWKANFQPPKRGKSC